MITIPSPTSPVQGENRRTQFRVIVYVVTDPHTIKLRPSVANTQTGPITIHCAAKLSAQCNNTALTMTTTFDFLLIQPSAIPEIFLWTPSVYPAVSRDYYHSYFHSKSGWVAQRKIFVEISERFFYRLDDLLVGQLCQRTDGIKLTMITHYNKHAH